MSKREIQEQIKQLRTQGKSKEFIRQSLQSVGWSDKAIETAYDEMSGSEPQQVSATPVDTYTVSSELKGLTKEQERYVRGFSGGALIGGIVWTLMNRLYLWTFISLGFALVPGGAFLVQIYLGIVGRKLAWKTGQWESFDAYKARQVLTNKVIILFYVASIVIAVLLVASGINFD